jgi:hypothetical protein
MTFSFGKMVRTKLALQHGGIFSIQVYLRERVDSLSHHACYAINVFSDSRYRHLSIINHGVI